MPTTALRTTLRLAAALVTDRPPCLAAARHLVTRPRRKPRQTPKPEAEKTPALAQRHAAGLEALLAYDLPALRLICDLGKQLGVMPPEQAWEQAQTRSLLLLEVQGAAQPPVWKLVAELPTAAQPAAPADADAPRGRTVRPPGKEARVKEVRLQDKSDVHDARTKLSFARGQLQKGRIVQVYVMDTGRLDPETKGSRAEALLALLTEGCEDLATAQVVPAPKRPQGKGIGNGGTVKGNQGLVRSATLTPSGYSPPAEPVAGQARVSRPSRSAARG